MIKKIAMYGVVRTFLRMTITAKIEELRLMLAFAVDFRHPM